MFLTVFLYVMIFIVALLLITLIMIQPSKSGGMGAAFGGIGESVFGGKAGSHLTKSTVVLTTIFFVVALALAAVIGHRGAGASKIVEQAAQKDAAVKSDEKPAAAVSGASAQNAEKPAVAPEKKSEAAPAKKPAAAPAKAPAKKPAAAPAKKPAAAPAKAPAKAK